MRDLKLTRRRAVGVVESVTGPLGPVPVERMVRAHLSFFQDLRTAGTSWSQISGLLRDAGLRTRRNAFVNENVLRASFARASRSIGPKQSPDHGEPKQSSSGEAIREQRAPVITAGIQSSTIGNDIASRMNRVTAIRRGHGGE
jgi:hypothetical protein